MAKILTNQEALMARMKNKARYENGEPIRRIIPPPPPVGLDQVVAAVKELGTKIEHIPEPVVDTESIVSAISRLESTMSVDEPKKNCTYKFRVTSRDQNGKAYEFEVVEKEVKE